MNTYDVVIVGSGLGGLLCGYMLGKEGYKVCILERNRQIGGSLQTFSRDKVIFDTGIHYIGGLSPGQNLHTCFTYFGLMDKLKIERMDMNGFDRITFDHDDRVFKYGQGYENFVNLLAQDFPHEREGIQQYADKLLEICDHFPLYNLRDRGELGIDFKYLKINAKEFISTCVKDTMLQNVLGGTNPLYAGDGEKTPLYVHALINNTYIESSWRCIDGGSQISKYLSRSIRSFGGEILRYKNAKKFIFEGGDLKYVEMQDGERFSGKYFISNIHPVKTLEMLEPGKVRPAYRNRLKSLENTVSVFTLHVVLKKDTFPYQKHNYYHYKKEDVWSTANYTEVSWPEGFSLFYSAGSKIDQYADCVNIMAYMRYDEVKQWESTFNTVAEESQRGGSYYDFKARKAELLIDAVEKRFPGFKDAIKSYYTSTPLTLRDYIGTDDGSLYGFTKDHRNPLRYFISPKTRVPNLLLTGQNLNMHGVLGVTISAIQTCGELLGMNKLLENINNSVPGTVPEN